MEKEAQTLEGGRLGQLGQHMLPHIPSLGSTRSCAVGDHTLCLGGPDGEAKGPAKAVHAIQKGLEAGDVRWQHIIISTHQGGLPSF